MIELLAQSVSAIFLLLGLVYQKGAFLIGGALIHAARSFVDLFSIYKAAKLRCSGALGPETVKPAVRVARWIENSITVTGLVFLVITRKESASALAVSGWLIWGGALISWFFSGVIVREVGGIPLRMGYGGWAVRRSRFRRRQK